MIEEQFVGYDTAKLLIAHKNRRRKFWRYENSDYLCVVIRVSASL